MRKGNREDGAPDPQVDHLRRVAKTVRDWVERPETREDLFDRSKWGIRKTLGEILDGLDADYVESLAWCHDSIEDQAENGAVELILDLSGGSVQFLGDVKALTRDSTQPYPDYIKEVLESSWAVIVVKLADTLDNIRNARPSLETRYRASLKKMKRRINAKLRS